MKAPSKYDFSATLSRFDGKAAYHYVEVPSELALKIIGTGSRRVIVKIFDKEYRRAILNRKPDLNYIFIGKAVMNEQGILCGAILDLEIWSDPNPEDLGIPEELTETLKQDKEAAERFYAFTPGRQRSMAHYVKTAKRTETKIKRSLELAHKLRTYTLYGDLNKES